MPKKSLELTDTFRHFDTLMWQIPTWSVAIAAAVIVAADQIRPGVASPWGAYATHVRALLLLFGTVLLAALSVVLHRWRAFQAASAPPDLPAPPFKQKPSAISFLQLASCLTTGGLGGFAFTHLLSPPVPLFLGFATGICAWCGSPSAECTLQWCVKSMATPKSSRLPACERLTFA